MSAAFTGLYNGPGIAALPYYMIEENLKLVEFLPQTIGHNIETDFVDPEDSVSLNRSKFSKSFTWLKYRISNRAQCP